MWRPGNHQNPPKSDFGIILRIFQEFCGNVQLVMEFHNFQVNLAKRGCLSGSAPRSLFSLRNIKVSEPPEYRKIVRNGYFLEIS